MNIIATGFLQLTITTNQQVLRDAMVRIYQVVNEELIYEDFFMSDETGKTPMIALYVEKKKTNEPYEIEIRHKNYRTQIRQVILFSNETREMMIQLQPDENDDPPRKVLKLPQTIHEYQKYLHDISMVYQEIPDVGIDEIDEERIKQAILAFQRMLGIREDGVIDSQTGLLLVQMDQELLLKG